MDHTPGAANIDRLRNEYPEVDAMLTHVDEAIERRSHEVEGGHIELEHTRASRRAARTEEAKPDVARDPVKQAAAKKKTAQKQKDEADATSRQMERLKTRPHMPKPSGSNTPNAMARRSRRSAGRPNMTSRQITRTPRPTRSFGASRRAGSHERRPLPANWD